MKFPRFFSIIPAILILFSSCFSQDKPKAELVNNFASNFCEGFLMDLQSFFDGLANESGSTGYVIIYPNKNSLKKSIFYEKLVLRAVYERKPDMTRLQIIHGEERDTLKVELWKVSPNAEKPEFTESKPINKSPDLSKPFHFDTLEIDGVCQTFVPEFYADLINANLTIGGKIIIFDSSKSGRREKAAEWLKIFTEDFKISHNRLKISFANDSDNFPYIEFWTVPLKTK